MNTVRKPLSKPALTSVLLAPHVTEKTSARTAGATINIRVPQKAAAGADARTDVRRAVELMFEVKVEPCAGGQCRR